MTTANVRHHLSILTAEGVVEVIGERNAGKRGRPAKLFTLTSYLRQDNLDELANVLLQELFSQQSSADRLVVLRKIAHTLATTNGLSKNLTQRFYKAIQRLNEMHYDAHWEAHAKAPFLIFRHCPYSRILPEHPVLCQLDALLLEELLGRSAQLIEKLAKDNLGVPYCKFIIRE